MKKILITMFITLLSMHSNAQSWTQDPHCLGTIYVDVELSELMGPGSEMNLRGAIPYGLTPMDFHLWSMQGLGSPILYSIDGSYFYFSIMKSHLKHAYMMEPNAIYTCELYLGTFAPYVYPQGEQFYYVQYQINDFNHSYFPNTDVTDITE